MKTQILILLSAVFFMHGAFAEETLMLIDDFIEDVKSLKKVIENE